MLISMRKAILLLAILLAASPALPQSPEPWATYRGNPQRTASTDGQPGPAAPKMLWALKSKDNFIASPVPVGNRLYVSGLGAFNLGNFKCLSTDPAAKTRELWVKTTPYLKLPTVSSPGLFKDYLVFGDGMHQTNGAMLYCVDAAGAHVWRHAVPGDLVHLEGSPTILDGKAFIGGGAAGVMCIEIDKATVDGKSHDLPSLQKLMAASWKDLQAKYEIEKKKDPLFAMPPTEDQLPKADPKRLWQEGKDKWHVDAPVDGGRRQGARRARRFSTRSRSAIALFSASTPRLARWSGGRRSSSIRGAARRSWATPSSSPASTIGYDYNVLKGAKGFIAGYNLKDGKPKWHKDITGGVVSCAALAGNSAVVTATDGKVRAFDIGTGDRQWIYDAKMPFFAAGRDRQGHGLCGRPEGRRFTPST